MAKGGREKVKLESSAGLRLVDKVGIEQVVADLRARGEL